jgi:hypothetical protein
MSQTNSVSTLPHAETSVNPRPSYYAIIPATVRYCKSLPPAAKLMFGEITALCSVEGYCWANNAYFQGLYDVDRVTVQRWLAALVKSGFIRVEVVPGTGRRIYDLTMRPINPPQNCSPPAAKMSPPRCKNEAHSITLSNTANIIRTLNVASGAVGSHVATAAREPIAPEEEDKVPASPVSIYALQSQKIDEVVSVTGDVGSRKRFQQLLDVTEAAGCWEVWRDALDALKTRQRASTGLLERPGAYFCSILVSALNARGVSVPVGTSSQRRTVKETIRKSMALSSD